MKSAVANASTNSTPSKAACPEAGRRPRAAGAALWLAASLTTFVALASLSGCSRQSEAPPKAAPPSTLITTTVASARALEVTEDTLGTLEALIDPKVGAEVPGRVIKVLVHAGSRVKKGEALAILDPQDFNLASRSDDAEVARLESLLAQQERLVQRQKDLVSKGFVSQNAVDDAVAQRNALRAQLDAAQARAASGRSNTAKTRVLAPIDGEIETQIIATGDYVKVGDPLFKMVSNRRLRAVLPYPESAAARIRRGQTVRLASPQNPKLRVEGVVDDIRPMVGDTSRAVDVLARFDNDAGLLAGGSVNASVVVDQRPNAILVPEQSVVLRPAGQVVYEVNGEKVAQRVVSTGVRRDGLIEVTQGLKGGETLALDGAGFLTDGAQVSLKARDTKAAQAPAAADKPPAAKN